jgi:hypothetical protein
MNNSEVFSFDEIVDKNTVIIINKSDKLTDKQK